MKKILFVLILGLTLSTTLFAQHANWSVKSENKIHWLETANDSILIVSSKNNIRAYNSLTGEMAWEFEDFKKADNSRFSNLHTANRALIFQNVRNYPGKKNPIRNKIYPLLIDISTGEIIDDNNTNDMYHCLGVYSMPNNNLLIYYYNQKKEILLRVIDVQNGNILWIDSLAYKKDKPKILKHNQSEDVIFKTIIGNQPPVFDSDSTMIILDNKKYVRKWNFHTGEILWSKEFKQKRHMVEQDNFAFAQFNADSSVLYMALNNTLSAIDVQDGSLVWQSKDLKKRIKQINQNESSIILKLFGFGTKKRYIFMSKINKIDGTIEYITDKICKNKNSSPMIWSGNDLIFYTDNHLYKFNHVKNESMKLSKKLNFMHGDKPQKFSSIGNSYYLQSSQNLMKFDANGNMIIHTYVQPPDISLGKALLMAAAIGFAVYHNSYLSFDVPEYKNSVQSKSYLYMLKQKVFHEPKRCDGLARIDFITGEVISELCLYTKTPIYSVDEVNDCVYYVKDKKTIVCQSW